jgi:hypothetical protein
MHEAPMNNDDTRRNKSEEAEKKRKKIMLSWFFVPTNQLVSKDARYGKMWEKKNVDFFFCPLVVPRPSLLSFDQCRHSSALPLPYVLPQLITPLCLLRCCLHHRHSVFFYVSSAFPYFCSPHEIPPSSQFSAFLIDPLIMLSSSPFPCVKFSIQIFQLHIALPPSSCDQCTLEALSIARLSNVLINTTSSSP